MLSAAAIDIRNLNRQLMSTVFVLCAVLLASRVVSAQEPGADGLGDNLYPQLGNGGYDVRHYTIDLAFIPAENQIEGKTSIDAVATQDLSSFNLDLLGLTVEQVVVNDVAASFERINHELIISPDQPLLSGDSLSVEVTYAGVPEPITDPSVTFVNLGWQAWNDDFFAAVSQPSGSMNWFPSNNHPLDKATYTIRVTAPEPNVAVANGVLSDTVSNDDGTRTFVWQMDQPMASYLAIVAVGDYVETRDDSGPVPIRNFFPAGTSASTIAGYDVTADIMSWLIDLLGPYPFAEYGVLMLPGFPAALETQSISIFGASPADELVIVHELLHQWFGNSVTLSQWSDTWLHEGFAAYFMALWVEKKFGAGAYKGIIRQKFAADKSMPAPGNPDISKLFDRSVYFRGALVLHALRNEVGDDTFFAILRQFYSDNAFGFVTTADFIAVAEALSQRDLGELFDAWLYGDTMPDLP